jgi:RNA polymerase sigma-70 factor (ECF subfamily)
MAGPIFRFPSVDNRSEPKITKKLGPQTSNITERPLARVGPSRQSDTPKQDNVRADNEVPTDQELIDSYRATGKRTALDELVRRHIERVRATIYPMVMNAAIADDLTQEVFLRAFHSLHRFEGESLFSTWLHRIAVNTTYSHLRRAQRNPVTLNSDAVEQSQSKDDDPGDQMLTSELGQQIEEGLASLSPRLRGALVRTAIEKMDAKQAAHAEGCSTATIYWRIHQARKQMKLKLKKYLSP